MVNGWREGGARVARVAFAAFCFCAQIPPAMTSDQQAQQQQQQQQQAEAAAERRRQLLVAILTPSARERLHRIHLVKPAHARRVEDTLLMQAQSERRVFDEQTVVQVAQALSEREEQPQIVVRRRWDEDQDDEEDYGF